MDAPILKLNKKKKIIFTLLTLFLFGVVLELGLQISKAVVNATGSTDPHYQLQSFQRPWSKEVLKNFNDVQSVFQRYVPFVEWAPGEFTSTYLNIGADHLRKNWNPEAYAVKKPVRIFMFGGSTTWGTGARDEYTMPSYVSKMLNERTARFEVQNHGQGSYTFTQEIVALIKELRVGNVPDYVIFYDGVNNISAAYGVGEAGTLLGENVVREKLESRSAMKLIKENTVDFLKNNCETCRLGVRLSRMMNPNSFRPEITGSKYTEAEMSVLAKEVADDYRQSLDLLHKLSQVYGFRYITFWQPTLFTEEKRVGDESKLETIDWGLSDKNLPYYYDQVLMEIKKTTSTRFFVITDALQDRKDQVYIDIAHLSEEGNEMVARRIVEVAKRQFGF